MKRGKLLFALLLVATMLLAVTCLAETGAPAGNVLMPTGEWFPYEDSPAFGGAITRAEVSSITFVDTLTNAPADAWDVSEAGDGSVLAWAVQNGNLYDVTVGGEGGVCAPEDMLCMFQNYVNATVIRFNGCFDTSGTTDMGLMFYGCESLTELDVSGFDTSNVINMSSMFEYCENVAELDVSGFDTSNVTNMSGMFYSCDSVTELDVSGFDTSNVTNMKNMFTGCENLAKLDVSGFDTSNVTDMFSMFGSCESLTELDVSGFDTSNVTDMGHMFGVCKNVTELDVSGFDTSNVINMTSMFSYCESLIKLDVSGFDTSKVGTEDAYAGMDYMFSQCESLTELDVSSFDTSNVKDMSGMFSWMNQLTKLDLSNFDTSNVENMRSMFSFCSSLNELDLRGFDTSKVTNMNSMFMYCQSLNSIFVDEGFVINDGTDSEDMLLECATQTLDATPSESGEGVQGFATLQRGDNGEAVARFQAKLVEKNYLYDVADGDYGEKTEIAVKLLQMDAGLEQTGIADAATQAALETTEHAFEAQAETAFLLYYGEYDSAQHIMRLHFKNIGESTITSFQFIEHQCDEARNMIGSFRGERDNGGQPNATVYTSPSFLLGSGTTYEAELSDFYDGNANMVFFPEGKYALYYIGKADSLSGNTFAGDGKKLYVALR